MEQQLELAVMLTPGIRMPIKTAGLIVVLEFKTKEFATEHSLLYNIAYRRTQSSRELYMIALLPYGINH